MSADQTEIAEAVAQFHEEVPHEFQVSLTMSMNTRDRVGEVRDELNDIAGERILTTNDIMRVALVAAGRYHALATGDLSELESIDREQFVPLTRVLRRVLENDDHVPDLPTEGLD